MKAISGMVGITRGSVRICGIDALEQRERAMSQVGCLIDAPSLYEHLSAEENLALAARYYPEVSRPRIAEVLELVGMESYRRERVATFSYGMRQRLGISLALLARPQLLILDEPGSGMDIEGMVQIREIIKNSAAVGAAVLISSHLAFEVEQCATQVAIINSGKLHRVAPLQAIRADYPNVEEYYLAQVRQARGERAS